MRLVGIHIMLQEKVWKLEVDYTGFDGNVKATRVYTWDFLSSTEALAKADELLKAEHN